MPLGALWRPEEGQEVGTEGRRESVGWHGGRVGGRESGRKEEGEEGRVGRRKSGKKEEWEEGKKDRGRRYWKK